MKKTLLLTLGALLISTQASAKVLKSLRCEGASLVAAVKVLAEPDEATIVAWSIEDRESGAASEFMGYLFTEGTLKEFSSTDLGSDLEVSGSVALVTFGEKEETLFCR